jgi:hypothetical protein
MVSSRDLTMRMAYEVPKLIPLTSLQRLSSVSLGA